LNIQLVTHRRQALILARRLEVVLLHRGMPAVNAGPTTSPSQQPNRLTRPQKRRSPPKGLLGRPGPYCGFRPTWAWGLCRWEGCWRETRRRSARGGGEDRACYPPLGFTDPAPLDRSRYSLLRRKSQTDKAPAATTTIPLAH